jgi:1,2-diacylglycerol 3-alpha-glucosyltransferase
LVGYLGAYDLRIILGTESFLPNISGVAVSSELLATNLAQKGHEVHVFAPSRSFWTHDDAGFGAFHVLRFRSIPHPFRKGFRISFLPQIEIPSMVKELRPDIVHLQDPGSISAALRKSARRGGIPVVIANHFTLDYAISYMRYVEFAHPMMRRILEGYLVRFYNECDLVLCPSETVQRELSGLGIKTPIVPVSNGVDLERFYSYSSPAAVRAKWRLPPAPVVLYVGRVDRDKSLDVLIHAIPNVIEEVDAQFVFVGDGNDLNRLRKMAEDLGLRKAVTFLGWIDHQSPDLPQLYQIAELFAIPAPFEAQSIVTLEAMAAGLPIVAADSGALPELVKDAENGILFPPGSSDELAGAIVTILANRALGEEMRKSSLRIVSAHRIANSLAKIEALYERARQMVQH